jgi:hypothetical protein
MVPETTTTTETNVTTEVNSEAAAEPPAPETATSTEADTADAASNEATTSESDAAEADSQASEQASNEAAENESAGNEADTANEAKSDASEPDAQEGETYYRTMSDQHLQTLNDTGKLSPTKETFISPTQSFSEGYDGNLVKFTLEPGTTESLMQIGVRNISELTNRLLPDMPIVSKGWAKYFAFFKGEGDQINIGLGKGPALDIFNDAITAFEEIIP